MSEIEKKVFARSSVLGPNITHYCPGCGHGIVHRLVAEAIEHYGIRERTVCVAPVGCSVLAYKYISIDMSEAAHGRAPAVATGIKRARPDLFVMTYQGDGDLAAIGTAEIVHAANRGENISVIFVNNAVYGMTGGQMAPTTMLGQKTTTTPAGRAAAERRPADQGVRDAQRPGRPELHRAGDGRQAGVGAEGEAGDHHGLRAAARRQGVQPGRSALALPDLLAAAAGQGDGRDRQLDGEELPVGRIQG